MSYLPIFSLSLSCICKVCAAINWETSLPDPTFPCFQEQRNNCLVEEVCVFVISCKSVEKQMKLSLLKKSPEERAYLFANQMPSGTNIQEIHPMFTEKCNSMLGAELLLYTPTSIVLERSTSESFWRQSV